MGGGRPNRELQRLQRESRDGLERAGTREDWRAQLDGLQLRLPKAAIAEQQSARNRFTLSGSCHGGFDLAVANGMVKGLPAGCTVAKRVTIREDTVIDGVEFVSDADTPEIELVLVTNGASVLFRNCALRGSDSMSASLVVVETGSCMFTGCFAYGATTADAIIDNQPGTVMTVAWLDSMNTTGVPLGAVSDAASPAWGGGASSPKVLAVSSDLDLSVIHEVLLVDTTAGNVTLSLPPAASYVGYRFTAKKLVLANNLIFDGNGAETVDGNPTLSWATALEANTVVSDGTAWWEVSN